MISYILLLRVFSVYIDRKKKNPIQVIRKFISKTKLFESVCQSIFKLSQNVGFYLYNMDVALYADALS